MLVVGIDPGTFQSAITVYNTDEDNVYETKIIDNDSVLLWLNSFVPRFPNAVFGIEKIASNGMAVGDTIFETVWLSGRFQERIITINDTTTIHRITRNRIKNHICHSSRANDSNIRKALINRFGKPGTKKKPGKTYGVSKDKWAALAVAVTCADVFVKPNPEY